VWFRRIGLSALAAFLIAGLVGVFGQTGESAYASSGAAELRVHASGALRSGLVDEEIIEPAVEIRVGVEPGGTADQVSVAVVVVR
jgi:hypothetical protein